VLAEARRTAYQLLADGGPDSSEAAPAADTAPAE
jgi:hypothetical protein